MNTLITPTQLLQQAFGSGEYLPPDTFSEADIAAADTLSQVLVNKQVKRVMPQLKMFAINLNRLTGDLPDWVLYHPSLDWWDPYTLFFTQEGKDEKGNLAGFANTPANLNYYYEAYPKKELAGTSSDEEEGTDTGSQTGSR